MFGERIGSAELSAQETDLLRWNHVYETVWPH